MHWDLRAHLLLPLFRPARIFEPVHQPAPQNRRPVYLLVTEDHFLRTGFLNGQFPEQLLRLRHAGRRPCRSDAMALSPSGRGY
jgi:hypothetical protein